MPYDEILAKRIRKSLTRRKNFEEKKMFGGIGFLLKGNLCVGVWKNSLVARVGPNEYEASLRENDVDEFDITGRPMTGWVLVHPPGIEEDEQLKAWLELALQFVRQLPAK